MNSKQNIETNVIKPQISFTEGEGDKQVNYLTISLEPETLLDNKIQEINDYMKNNQGKGKTNDEKDEIYKNSQVIWKEMSVLLRDTKYNFNLNRKQYVFLTDLILKKLEYDVNTIFFAIDLSNLLRSMKGKAIYSNDNDLIPFPVDATEITYIYHLISNHKVKGLTTSSFLFAEVLRRIGDISKIFNYYDATLKGLSSEIKDWVVLFEDGVTKEEVIEEEVIEEEVIEEEVAQATIIEPKS